MKIHPITEALWYGGRGRRYWMQRKIERLAIAIAWRLPRKVAFWAFVRVATEGCEDNPADQSVGEIMDRWEAP